MRTAQPSRRDHTQPCVPDWCVCAAYVCVCAREGERERERGREREREGERERERGREGGREGEREGGKEGGREKERERAHGVMREGRWGLVAEEEETGTR